MATGSCSRHVKNVALTCVLVALAPGCSCRDLPSLTGGAGGSGAASGTNVGGGGTASGAGGTGAGAGAAGAGGSGGTGGACSEDVLSDRENCGACGNACAAGRPCVGGACRLEPASSGALAVTLDSALSPQSLVWGHAFPTALQRTTVDGFVTSTVAGSWLPSELVGAGGRIGVLKNLDPLSYNPTTVADAVWFGVTGDPMPAPLCPAPALMCPGVSDFAANRDLMAWTGPSGTSAFLDTPTLVFAEPASSTAYFLAPPLLIAAFAGDGSAQATHPMRLMFQVGQPMIQTLDWPEASARYRPQNMVLAVPAPGVVVLFWLTPEGHIDCADMISLLDAELPPIVRYATLPSPASALEFAADTLFVAMEGGMIASGPLTCTAPQGSLDVLVEPSPVDLLGTLGLAVRDDPSVEENNVLFFTRLALNGNPDVNEAYGGVYFRPLATWQPLRTLEL